MVSGAKICVELFLMTGATGVVVDISGRSRGIARGSLGEKTRGQASNTLRMILIFKFWLRRSRLMRTTLSRIENLPAASSFCINIM